MVFPDEKKKAVHNISTINVLLVNTNITLGLLWDGFEQLYEDGMLLTESNRKLVD
jgi:hypothetical protein